MKQTGRVFSLVTYSPFFLMYMRFCECGWCFMTHNLSFIAREMRNKGIECFAGRCWISFASCSLFNHFWLKGKKYFYCSAGNRNSFLVTQMGFGINILLSDLSVPTEALGENNFITVPWQVMPSLLTSHILTISLSLHTVISIPSCFSVAVYFSAVTICIEIIQFMAQPSLHAHVFYIRYSFCDCKPNKSCLNYMPFSLIINI